MDISMHRLSLQRQNDPNLAVSEQQGKKSARLLFPVKPTTQKEKKKKERGREKKENIRGKSWERSAFQEDTRETMGIAHGGSW